MTTTITLGTHHKTGQGIQFPVNTLTKHTAIVGMTGSGKTGTVISIVEELAKNDIPVLMVDIKGDLPNIFQQPDHIQDKINPRIITPGGTHGDPINLFANIDKPSRRDNTVSNLLKMIKDKNLSIFSSKHVFLSKILEYAHKNNLSYDLSNLIEDILEPPFEYVENMSVDKMISDTQRQALAVKLNNILIAPSFSDWTAGASFEVSDLLNNSVPGKTNLSVFSVAHLINEDQRMFALSTLFDEIIYWMRQQQGHDGLKAAVIIDECVGLLPPYPKNPPTKNSIITLLKQARAFGLGFILATQNPKDIDYKALSNCETWIVGNLKTKHDKDRVLEAVASSTQVGKRRLDDMISLLSFREFIVVRPRGYWKFKSKDCTAHLTGPMVPSAIQVLNNKFKQV